MHSRPARTELKPFARPDGRSAVQVATTAGGLFGGWVLVEWAWDAHLALVAVAGLVIAVFSVRAFIVMHDCGHGSFTRSRRANDVVGTIAGVVLFTPYRAWSHSHAYHHAASGDLDRRGVGDVWTLTVDEYRSAPRARRLRFRLYHNPVVMALLGPPVRFLILGRFAGRHPTPPRRVVLAVHLNNVALAAAVVAMCVWMGPRRYAVTQLFVIYAAGIPAVWLFYVQHRFPGAYWRRRSDWDADEAALASSSWLRLPRALDWATGHIGYHHLHHLDTHIPNYRLPEAQVGCPWIRPGAELTLWSSVAALRANLWDESARRYVTFAEARA
jgi:omega-6 fatty acid desaturase (delta-12 desaturase)